jgi:hypothetical protein
MAGLGQVCVHVAALLFKIEAAVKLGYTTRSSTSAACTWNKQFRAEVNMFPVADMCSKSKDLIQSSRKSYVPTVSSSSVDPLPDMDTLLALRNCCPDAVFFTLIPKLSEDDTDTAEEDETLALIPLLTSVGDEIIQTASY